VTLWEHCLWVEIERCKRADLDKVEFAKVDELVIQIAKTLKYEPPPSESAC